MVVVKGCEWEASRVKEATLLLMEHLCGGGGTGNGAMLASVGASGCGNSIVTMNMEISPQHHSIVLGKVGGRHGPGSILSFYVYIK
jgi:protein bicaudal C